MKAIIISWLGYWDTEDLARGERECWGLIIKPDNHFMEKLGVTETLLITSPTKGVILVNSSGLKEDDYQIHGRVEISEGFARAVINSFRSWLGLKRFQSEFEEIIRTHQ